MTMGHVTLYVPENEAIPAAVSILRESGVIDIVRDENRSYATIEKKECACHTKNGMAVFGRSFAIANKRAPYGHSAYRLPPPDAASTVEHDTALHWLLAPHYYTFHTRVRDEIMNRLLKEAYKKMFKISTSGCSCIRYDMKNVCPVFCLQNIVVSREKKGPTIESVLP